MPNRRPSASAGPPHHHPPPRIHKSNESYHALYSLNSMLPQQHGYQTSADKMSPQQKVVQVLVTRLRGKLPCNSGVSLDRLEGDNTIQQVIEALVELSTDSLDTIVYALSELLERLSSQAPDPPSIEILQSQLFVLKVLSLTLSSRWTPTHRSNSRAGHNTSAPSESSHFTGSTRVFRQASSDHSIPPPTSQEPVPLNDDCAKYVLSVMVLFIQPPVENQNNQLMMSNSWTDISFRDFEGSALAAVGVPEVPAEAPSTPVTNYARPRETVLRAQSSSTSVKSSKLSLNSTILIPGGKVAYEKTHVSQVRSTLPVTSLICKYAGKVVFQVSASNYDAVYTRIRGKIRSLERNSNESPDLADLQLMAHSILDRNRLVQLLTELSSLLVTMGKESRSAIADPLRYAVWSWITNFPAEFDESLRYRGKTDGAPERVFDLLYSISQSGDEKTFWPTLTILNCTSDRLKNDFESSYTNSKGSRKEIRFGEEILKHAHGQSRLSDVALVCMVDMCRAATYIKPEGEVALQSIAYDLAHEIKSALSSHAHRPPFWETQEEIDVGMYAEALVALWRFLPIQDALPLFETCLEADRSEAVKLCVVRALLTLTKEASRIKWQHPLDTLLDMAAPRFRSIFTATALRRPELDASGNTKRAAGRPRARRTPFNSLTDRELLLLGMLSLWQAEPLFHLKHITTEEIEEWVTTANKIWEAPIDIYVKIFIAGGFQAIAEAMYSATPPDPPDSYFSLKVSFLKITLPAILLNISTNLLQERKDVEAQKLWVIVAHQLVELFSRKSDSPLVKSIQTEPLRVPAFILAEIAFLISLTSADSNISYRAATGLRLIILAEKQPDVPVNPHMSEEDNSKRSRMYEQLGDPKVVIVGRVGHQKRIRKYVRSITYPSAAHIAVWNECYWRWRELSEAIYDTMKDDDSQTRRNLLWKQDERFQWQNLTLFLAALGGACLLDSHETSSLASALPAQWLPDSLRVMHRPGELITMFIKDLTNLLVYPDTQIQELAKDALGAELSPRLHAKLLRHLDGAIREIEDGAGTILTDNYILFADQFIGILKLIVENDQVSSEDISSIDISSTILTLATFMSRFTDSNSYRVKHKFCLMCESVCDRTDALASRKESNARHEILDAIMRWIQPLEEGQFAGIQADLNLACLRTSVKLLHRLQLRPMDNTITGDDRLHVVSRMFNKFAGFLLQAMEPCRGMPPRPATVLKSDPQAEIMAEAAYQARIAQRAAEVRELTITGLSHLVSANTESGFKQSLQLAYDNDLRKRAIFAHVFARVLGQGTKFDPEDRSATQARNNRLFELVRGSDMILALTVCEVCPASETDMMVSVLLNVFNTRSSILALIKAVVEKEVAASPNEMELFRGNNTYTKLLGTFAKIHGYSYLRQLLVPLTDRMLEMAKEGLAFDMDPNRIHPEEQRNKPNVESAAMYFLDLAARMAPDMPAIFKEICAHISSTVVMSWPNSRYSVTGAFIFLRFIIPAMVSPENVDISFPPEHNWTVRRGLMLIAKIIQNLSNNMFFGKEKHMTCLNDFLRQNITVMTRYLNDLQKPVSPEDSAKDHWLGATPDDTDVIVLHRFFDRHADKIGKELLSLSKPASEGDPTAANGKRAWDGLCSLLVDFGSPYEVPRPALLPRDQHTEYQSLMSRNAGRDTAEVEDIFITVDTPEARDSIFILRLSKINVEAHDIELLMYHALEPHQDRNFDLILDCTCFSSMSEVPLQWLKYCAELVPSDVRLKFQKTRILNPNNLTLKFLRRLYNLTAGAQFCQQGIHSYKSVDELKEHVPPEALPHLVLATSLEAQRQVCFAATRKRPQRPVSIHVAEDHCRIVSVTTQAISASLSCEAVEIYYLSDISDAYKVNTGTEADEFIMRKNGVTMYFASDQRDEIVKSIREAKGRLKDGAHMPTSDRFSRFSNVPATLLHIGLLSISLNHDELRGAAYELLGAVCQYLQYSKTPAIATQAGFIPGDPAAYGYQLSEKLARHSPRLTLDFIPEVTTAMDALADISQRISCLQYMSPWIKNLVHFSDPTNPLWDRSGARVRDCIRQLTDMTASNPEIIPTVQRYIWSEIGRLEPVTIDAILDEVLRAAHERGQGTQRAEAIIRAVTPLASIGVRGRVHAKLRKTMTRVNPSTTNTMTDITKHASWQDIFVLARFCLFVGASKGQPGYDQLFVPETVHTISLLAAAGPLLLRRTVYGIAMNLLQALYHSRTEDTAGADLLQLISDLNSPEVLNLFGLQRYNCSSEYTTVEPPNDKECLDNQERLIAFFLKTFRMASGSKGIENVWRARLMGLTASVAFQVSPYVQARAFNVLGALATSDVDDDFVYQILVALSTALAKTEDGTFVLPIVSIVRCLCSVVPAMSPNSRFLPSLFWFAVSLLQASTFSFYVDACRLLCATIEGMEARGLFTHESVATVLLDHRSILAEATSQLDKILALSFETNFSFSLAAIIFKGIRQNGLKEAAEQALRCLLRITIRSETPEDVPDGFRDSIPSDALGYFIALLPVSTSQAKYRSLLDECQIDRVWLPDAGIEDEDDTVPHISLAFLGVEDSTTALLVTTFAGPILVHAQGDATETEILFSILSEIGNRFPHVIALCYPALQERLRAAFSDSSNASIIRSASNIFRISLHEGFRSLSSRGAAASTTSFDDTKPAVPSQEHKDALKSMKMEGLASSFQFLPRDVAAEMLQWIPRVVAHMLLA